jgi:hypothetical protein
MTDTTTENLTPAAQNVNYGDFAGWTPDMLIEFYVKLRDRIEAENKAFAKRMEAAKTKKTVLEGIMLQILQANGATSMKSPGGTVYQTTKRSATLGDAEAFREFIIDNHAFELADIKANAAAVEDYANEHNGNLPPGVNFSQFVAVGVRRGDKKDDSKDDSKNAE